MPTPTVENYLKQLYLEQPHFPNLVPMGHLASAMDVTPGTATSMIKTLADSGLVHYEPRSGAKLNEHGQRLALHVLRRHRLIELFLVNILGLDWSEVHNEADQLEHVVSDKVLERIDKLLDHPTVDPHGDPIPTADGDVHYQNLIPLSESPTQNTVTITRIIDQDPKFLRFIDKYNLTLDTKITVISIDIEADAMTIQPQNSNPITIGLTAASKIHVTS